MLLSAAPFLLSSLQFFAQHLTARVLMATGIARRQAQASDWKHYFKTGSWAWGPAVWQLVLGTGVAHLVAQPGVQSQGAIVSCFEAWFAPGHVCSRRLPCLGFEWMPLLDLTLCCIATDP